MELSLFFELETSDLSEAGVKRTFDQCIEQTMLADQLGYRAGSGSPSITSCPDFPTAPRRSWCCHIWRPGPGTSASAMG
ncbi:MAG: hypothetical protein ACRD19_02895 [Terriglobia bacterium]